MNVREALETRDARVRYRSRRKMNFVSKKKKKEVHVLQQVYPEA